jgi:uncharacterized protein
MASTETLTGLFDRLLDRVRAGDARAVEVTDAADGALTWLAPHGYCLLVTYRKSGDPIPTPVWFGVCSGRVYVRTAESTAKVKRIRANERAAVGPCTRLGRPLGPALECTARLLDDSERLAAESAIQAKYRIIRRLYGMVDRDAGSRVYIELTLPAPEPRTAGSR